MIRFMKTECSNKTELVRLFSESINKHCETSQDVANMIEAISQFNTFMDKQKEREHEFILDIRSIKEFMYESCADGKMLDDIYLVADEFIAAMILSQKFEKESDILLQIVNDTEIARDQRSLFNRRPGDIKNFNKN